MNADQRIKLQIGDLIVAINQQAALIEELQAKVAEQEANKTIEKPAA